MEFNTQNSEKSEQIRWSSDDQVGPGQVRSYTCAFCKRGFSNAQALGGNMNIHRRDRAKLKQSSEENLLSLNISIKNNVIDHESQPLEGKILSHLDSGKEKHTNNNHKKPCTFPAKDDHAPQKSKVVLWCRGLERKTDVDLELRLGPEPQEAPTLSTREFF